MGGSNRLKRCFFSVPIPDRLKPVTNFRVGKNIYQFNRLPKGLFISPFILQRILNEILAELASSCEIIFSWAHIHDIIILTASPYLAHLALIRLFYLLHNSGFHVNVKKSLLRPAQKLHFCGLVLDLKGMAFDFARLFQKQGSAGGTFITILASTSTNLVEEKLEDH